MSKTHTATVQKQFTSTADAFSKQAVRDGSEVVAEKVEFARPQAGDCALDVACGPGTLVLALAARVRIARGIDLTEAMLRQARAFQAELGIANAAFDQGEAEQLPYADAAFDLVTCQFSFHHLPKPELVLNEMMRVLKPGGRAMIIDMLAPESDPKFDLHNRIERARDPSHTASLRWTAFRAMFEEQGLKIVDEKIRRRQRSFNHWMLRAGLEPGAKGYLETRKLMEDSIPGDSGAFRAVAR